MTDREKTAMRPDEEQAKRVPHGPLGETVMHEVRRQRERQNLTYKELADRMSALGRPIIPNGLRRIERGERRVDVDDLAALAGAFGIAEPWDLTKPSCEQCAGFPPSGYSCMRCGRAGEDDHAA